MGHISRNTTAASFFALLLVVFASVSPQASASSTLLSGYGGPGAGAQTIVGATLLSPAAGGRHGSAAAGAAAAEGGEGGALGQGREGGVSGGEGRGGTSGGAPQRGGSGSPQSAGRTGSTMDGSGGGAYRGVYPTALRRARSSSPALGLTEGDLLVVVGIAAALAALGGLTIRTTRLQR